MRVAPVGVAIRVGRLGLEVGVRGGGVEQVRRRSWVGQTPQELSAVAAESMYGNVGLW